MEQILLTDEKIKKVLIIARKHKWEHRVHPEFEVEYELLEAQLKNVEAWLCAEFKYLTMSAETLKLFNDIRQALLKEVE